MVFVPRKGKGKKGKAKGFMPKTKKAPATKTQAVALIKEVIAREEETKLCINTVLSAGSISAMNNKVSLLPKLVQDQGEGNAYERMATKITPRKLRIKCHVGLLAGLTRSTAITVHWYALTSRQYKNMNDVLASANTSRLLRTGSFAQYFGFDGNVDVAMLPINDTDFVVLKSGKFNLSKNTGVIQDSTSTGNQPLVGPASKSWSFDLNTPAKFIYEQDNNSPRTVYYPNNYAPFIVYGYTHQDGSSPDNVNTDVKWTVQSQLYYDDA